MAAGRRQPKPESRDPAQPSGVGDRAHAPGNVPAAQSPTPPAGAARFDRSLSAGSFTCIGRGDPGGKAAGLGSVKTSLEAAFPQGRFEDIRVSIPRMTVLLTGVFEEFMTLNRLDQVEWSELEDEHIARRFQKAELPATVVGDLLSLISSAHEPLAIRSSSLLEDSLQAPFAGVYETKMIPNNQPEAEARFRKLVEAIKLVYASTYFRSARQYFRSIGRDIHRERMAVIIQEVVGYRYGERFYPTVSGVARSYNFYPSGNARPEEGVVTLALGLGKTIVDGGQAWSYSPAFPQAPPPYGGIADLLKNTQTRYWSVYMGTPREYDPLRETEYLCEGSLEDAERDGTLAYLCSTYDAAGDRLRIGIDGPGPRLVDFAPLLKGRIIPLSELLRRLLVLAEDKLGSAVEIEFALAFDPRRHRESRFGFLQVSPMASSPQDAEVCVDRTDGRAVLLRSERAMGNGAIEDLREVVYVLPEAFRPERSPAIAAEIETFNSRLLEGGTPYLLLGFGRWGSADPWLGIPVRWGQISGARVIVETTLPEMNPDLSQGSHFFHNLANLGVVYLCVQNPETAPVDWQWLARQQVVDQTETVRHVRCARPVSVRVDGRTGRGVILE